MIAKDITAFLGRADLTGHQNSAQLAFSREPQDKTVFGNDERRYSAGLMGAELGVSGFVDYPLEGDLLTEQDADQFIASVVCNGDGKTPGQLVYSFPAILTSYEPGAAVGEEYQFSAGAMLAEMKQGDDQYPLLRGQTFDFREEVSAVTDGASTPVNLGAIASGEARWFGIHLLHLGVDDIDIAIQSASASSAPFQTRINLRNLTAEGSYIRRVAGPLTDAWWRTLVTITDTSAPPAPIACVAIVTGDA